MCAPWEAGRMCVRICLCGRVRAYGLMCAFIYVSIVILYVFIWVLHVHIVHWTDGRCLGVINRDPGAVFMIVQYKPNEYRETCRVQLWLWGQHMSVLAQTHNEQMCYSNLGTNSSSEKRFILWEKVASQLFGWSKREKGHENKSI